MGKVNAVLVIDDDPFYQCIIERVITQSLITDKIIKAENGLEGIRKISEFISLENICPELILVDIEMPVMDGIEFIRSFNNMSFLNKNNVTIIANSGNMNLDYQQKLISLGVTYCWAKPILKEMLLEVVLNQNRL